jgi:hypothetical protein
VVTVSLILLAFLSTVLGRIEATTAPFDLLVVKLALLVSVLFLFTTVLRALP